MTLPEKIYLPRAAARAHNLRQDGWAEHEYVRGDIYKSVLAVNEALRAEIESLKQPDTCTPIVPDDEWRKFSRELPDKTWEHARARVWEKWPGAVAVYFGDGTAREWIIWKRASDDFELGHGIDEESAWIDAASRLSEGGND